jgi:hypothetical protein
MPFSSQRPFVAVILINITYFEIHAAQIDCSLNVLAAHFYTVAIIKGLL